MKFMMGLALIFVLGCSSTPAPKEVPVETTALPKAKPVKQQDRMYRPSSEPETPMEVEALTPPPQGRSCETPLGEIRDGGSATGYLKPEVPANEVCISDTIRCLDGTWSGQAIYPNCRIKK